MWTGGTSGRCLWDGPAEGCERSRAAWLCLEAGPRALGAVLRLVWCGAWGGGTRGVLSGPGVESAGGERGVPAQLSGWARPERWEVSVDVDSCLFQRLRGAETAWGRGPEAAWGCEAAWDFPPVTGCGGHGVACLMVCWTECEG